MAAVTKKQLITVAKYLNALMQFEDPIRVDLPVKELTEKVIEGVKCFEPSDDYDTLDHAAMSIIFQMGLREIVEDCGVQNLPGKKGPKPKKEEPEPEPPGPQLEETEEPAAEQPPEEEPKFQEDPDNTPKETVDPNFEKPSAYTLCVDLMCHNPKLSVHELMAEVKSRGYFLDKPTKSKVRVAHNQGVRFYRGFKKNGHVK